MISADLLDRLRTISVLRGLDTDTFNALLPHLYQRDLAGGDTLFRRGDRATSLYFVLSGRLKAWHEGPRGPVAMGEISLGETAGEQALLCRERRYANVVAMRDCVLVGLNEQGFDALARTSPETLLAFTAEVVRRLTHAHGARPERPYVRTVAIVPVMGSELAQHAAGQLARQLVRYCSWSQPRLLTAEHWQNKVRASAQTSTQASTSSKPSSRLLHWLSELELSHGLVVYLATDDPEWQALCLRQADKVLWVADAKEQASVALAQLPCMEDQELVLLHGQGVIAPGATAQWLAHWPCKPAHEVQGDAPAELVHYAIRYTEGLNKVELHTPDVHRLGRMLTGKALGLVLGGGGARGFAHIGLLRYLEERGMQVDLTGGTSMGAMLAAGIAAGWDSRQLEAAARELFVEHNYLRDYTVPVVSLISVRRFRKALDRTFKGLAIEDLPRSYFCVSTNLSELRAQIHRRGPMYQAVGASMSIPGIAPPQISNGQLLVDGGLVNNLPLDLMCAQARGPLLGSDVATEGALHVAPELQEAPHWWVALKERLGGQPQRFPSMASIIYTAATAAGTAHERSMCAMYPVVDHDLSEFGLFDWQKIDQIIECGYRSAEEQFPLLTF